MLLKNYNVQIAFEYTKNILEFIDLLIYQIVNAILVGFPASDSAVCGDPILYWRILALFSTRPCIFRCLICWSQREDFVSANQELCSIGSPRQQCVCSILSHERLLPPDTLFPSRSQAQRP